MRHSVLRIILMAIAAMLLVQVSGCASWWDRESDAVREAVIVHQLDEQGIRVDDVVIRLSPSEFRADFGRDSRMVWLISNAFERQYREGEYFRARNPQRSYLFIQDIRYGDSQSHAMVTVVLYLLGQQPITRELTLHKAGVDWEVVAETQVG